MKQNKLTDLSVKFALAVLELCSKIKGHYSIVDQLERSSTSIGANIREANYAQSNADFLSKMKIALKECYETDYWLELFLKAGFVEEESVKHIITECGRIRYLLIKSINTLETKIKITSAKPKSE